MYRSAVAIESWLSQSDNDDGTDDPISPSDLQSPQHAHNHSNYKRKRKRSTETTPPPMLREYSTSPKKLKFDAYNTNDVPLLDNLNGTLRSSAPPARTVGFNIPNADTLQFRVPSMTRSSVSQSSVTTSSNKTAGSKRLSSLVKNTDGLQYLDKPVIYGHLDDDPRQLPVDVVALWDSVYDVVRYSTGIYPTEIRSEIASLHRRPPPENNFRAATANETRTGKALGEGTGQGASVNSTIAMQKEFPDQLPAVWAFARANTQPSVTRQRLALAELRAVQNIIREARRCLDGRYSEATWNSRVHEPLLELALFRHEPHVRHVNATSATVLPAFMPCFSTGNTVVGGKMINFVLTRYLDYENPVPADVELAAAIRTKLACQPGSRSLTVNQTDYTPLTRPFAAVAIGAKILVASMEEARVQLALWTAAWRRRMEALGIAVRGKASLPTLPLIQTMDHSWSLFFACDRGITIVRRSLYYRLCGKK